MKTQTNTTPKFTQGEWKIDESVGIGWVVSVNNTAICKCGGGFDTLQIKANAKLISKSSEMYRLLNELTGYSDGLDQTLFQYGFLDKIKAILKEIDN